MQKLMEQNSILLMGYHLPISELNYKYNLLLSSLGMGWYYRIW